MLIYTNQYNCVKVLFVFFYQKKKKYLHSRFHENMNYASQIPISICMYCCTLQSINIQPHILKKLKLKCNQAYIILTLIWKYNMNKKTNNNNFWSTHPKKKQIKIEYITISLYIDLTNEFHSPYIHITLPRFI